MAAMRLHREFDGICGIETIERFLHTSYDQFAGRAADIVVTMGCGDACPIFPGKRYEDWVLDDPSDMPIEEIRPICDEIERRVRELLEELEVPVKPVTGSLTRLRRRLTL
jgi:protein-tyrosine-phosphatase